MSIQFLDIGLVDYGDAWKFQQHLVDERLRGAIPDTLVFCEHARVATLGRRTPREDVFDPTLPVVEVERGGQATYHAPGQLVGYPIIDLEKQGRDLRGFLRRLERLLIEALGELGVEAFAQEGLTGVWTAHGKIASIGIAVRRWISWHGFALNCDNDPADFACIRPCGLDAKAMTSLSACLGSANPGRSAALQAVKRCFARDFGEPHR